MFWKIIGSTFISLFLVSETHFIPTLDKVDVPLTLVQQKEIIEWNLKQNEQIADPTSQVRLQTKIEKLKKQDYRLFIEETTTLPQKDLKIRVTQEVRDFDKSSL